jgi:hypothetical protein
MLTRSQRLSSIAAAAITVAQPLAAEPLRVTRVVDDSRVELAVGVERATVALGERFGDYTLMALLPQTGTAVLEDFTVRDGALVFVESAGVIAGFRSPKCTAIAVSMRCVR